jgi:hypothetical protein
MRYNNNSLEDIFPHARAHEYLHAAQDEFTNVASLEEEIYVFINLKPSSRR